MNAITKQPIVTVVVRPYFDCVIASAHDEDGLELTSHTCSDESFVRHDIQRPRHLERMRQRYPGGFQLMFPGEQLPADVVPQKLMPSERSLTL